MSFSDYREKIVGDAQWAKMTPFPNRRRTPCLSFSSGKAPFHRRTRWQDLLKKALFCWDMGTYTPIAVQQIIFIHMSDLTSVNIIIIIHPGSFLHSLIWFWSFFLQENSFPALDKTSTSGRTSKQERGRKKVLLCLKYWLLPLYDCTMHIYE